MQAQQYPVGPTKMAVNKQFNSPINLYSNQSLNETLSKQSSVLSNGAVGIDFNQLAAPNLAKSAVLRMLEEEETGSRGEILNCTPPAAKIFLRWPPPSPPNSPPSRRRDNEQETDRRIKSVIAWPPMTANPQTTNERTKSSWRNRTNNYQGGVKRVAWPPPPDSEQNFPYSQGESNGIILEANPPAPLYYSPSGGEEQQNQPRWEATEPAVTVFSIPSKVLAPAPPPPSVITLRSQPPITQAPPPVYKSQPAIEKQTSKAIPGKMLGDQKWPPADYKAKKAAEQMEQASKPQLKPKLVKKDYSSFFAQHALTPNYTGYRVPPGTQHFDENGRPMDGNM